MIKRNMTREQVLEMVKANGWEIYREEELEMYGDEYTEMTILQDDHAVTVDLDEEGVYEIVFVPLWALN